MSDFNDRKLRAAIGGIRSLARTVGVARFTRAYYSIGDRVDATRVEAIKLAMSPKGDTEISDDEIVAMMTTLLLHLGVAAFIKHATEGIA